MIELAVELATSWAKFERVCESFKETQACLGPTVIKNCMSITQFDENVLDNYIDFVTSIMYAAGDYSCGRGMEGLPNQSIKNNHVLKNLVLKSGFSYISSQCKIDRSSCSTLQQSINKCANGAKNYLSENMQMFLEPVLSLRECFKNPDCDFCDSRIEKVVSHF